MEKTYFNIARIEKFMQERGLSKTAFCKLCHISLSTYYRIMKDDLSLKMLPVFRVAKSMQIELKDLFTDKK